MPQARYYLSTFTYKANTYTFKHVKIMWVSIVITLLIAREKNISNEVAVCYTGKPPSMTSSTGVKRAAALVKYHD